MTATNPYDKANELARAIKDTDAYRNYLVAKEEIEKDLEARQKIFVLRQHQMEVNRAQVLGEKVPEDKLRDVAIEYAELSKNPGVAAFFEGVPDQQYAVNRAIDNTLRALTWDDMEGLMKSAGLLRVPRHLALLRDVVKQAQADWPTLLRDAPPAVRTTVQQRLAGAVRISQGTRAGKAGGG